MRKGHWMIVFFIIAMVFVGNLWITKEKYQVAVMKKEMIDTALKMAVDTSAKQMAQNYQNINVPDFLFETSNTFFHSLSSELHLYEEIEQKEELTFFVPALFVSETNGFYVNYLSESEKNGIRQLHRVWSECQPYMYDDEYFIYRFFLDDTIIIYQKETGEYIESTVERIRTDEDLLTNFSMGKVFECIDSYEEYKRNAIAESIRRALERTVQEHNRIAGQYGICAIYGIPSFLENFTPAMEYPSFVAIFQGYPLVYDGTLMYSNASSSAAYITRIKQYIVEVPNRLSQPFAVFHKQTCENIGRYGEILLTTYSMEIAMKEYGAYACPFCFKAQEGVKILP